MNKNKRLNLFLLAFVLSGGSLLGGCATTGSSSSSARPAFYPNATFNQVGAAEAQHQADLCINNARNAGFSPDDRGNAVGAGAAKGAAVGGVAALVGALVQGRSNHALESAVQGAAVGGSAGAVSGAFQEKPNGVFRQYVQRCLKDKGFDVIGWN